jgi:HEXXH motif-containing protein
MNGRRPIELKSDGSIPHDAFSGWPEWPLAGAPSNEPTDPDLIATLMWTEAALQAPHRNAARVLGWIRHLLDAQRPLQGRETEFLKVYDRLASGPPQAFAAVWSDPRAYHWTRVAHRLVGELPALEPLALHLSQFKVFALGLAVLTSEDWTFEEPLQVDAPFAIPGTRWSLDGPEVIDILGIRDGKVLLMHGGDEHAVELGPGPLSSVPGLEVLRCPVAVQGDYELWIHPHALNVPAFEITEPSLRAGLAYHEQQIGLVTNTLSSMARHAPRTFGHFAGMIRLAGLKPASWGGFDDFSEPELTGSFVASVVENPLELGDHFIHEFQHNRLSCIEESGSLFEAEGNTATAPNYYSPWRNKPRGLYGLFHGVYVFVAVHDYWMRVHETARLDAAASDYVLDRVIRIPLQLELGVAVLDQHANLTPLGRSILDELTRNVARIRDAVQTVGLPDDTLAFRAEEDGSYSPETADEGRHMTVRESVLEHVRRYDVNNQAAGVLGEVPAARP